MRLEEDWGLLLLVFHVLSMRPPLGEVLTAPGPMEGKGLTSPGLGGSGPGGA